MRVVGRDEIREDKYFHLLTEAILERDQPRTTDLFFRMTRDGHSIGDALSVVTAAEAPFGGIIVVNRPLDLPLAKAITEIFSEVIIAPEFAPDPRALLQKKKNLRLMRALRPAAVPNEKPEHDRVHPGTR